MPEGAGKRTRVYLACVGGDFPCTWTAEVSGLYFALEGALKHFAASSCGGRIEVRVETITTERAVVQIINRVIEGA